MLSLSSLSSLQMQLLLLLVMMASPVVFVAAWAPPSSLSPSLISSLSSCGMNRHPYSPISSSFSSCYTHTSSSSSSSSSTSLRFLQRCERRNLKSLSTTCRRATSHHHSMDETSASTTTTSATSPPTLNGSSQNTVTTSSSTTTTASLPQDSLQNTTTTAGDPWDDVWKGLFFLVPNRIQDLTPNNRDTDNRSSDDGGGRGAAGGVVVLTAEDKANVQKSLLNLSVLLCSFGFALYTVLNIDSEITRGWTQQEIAMRIPIDNWAGYESALQEAPILTKTTINVVIYLLGDWLSQTLFQKKSLLDFDVRRTLRNGFIGLCFGPLVHWYYEWSDTILPVEGGIMNRLQKIGMDQTLYLSIKCSIYIMAVGCLQGDSIQTSWNNVQQRIVPICFTAWKFWPLIHCITYSVIPSQHRILWVNCVDLVWNAILATMSRSTAAEEEGTTTFITSNSTDSEVILVMAADGTTSTNVAVVLEEDLVPMPVLAGGSEVLTAVGNEALLIRDFVLEMASSYNNDENDDDMMMQKNDNNTMTITTTMSEETEDSS